MYLDVTDLSSVQNDVVSTTEYNHNDLSSWAVSVVVSKWYDELFQNWLYWFQRLSTNMTLILIAEDEFICQKYSNRSQIKVMSLNMNIVSFFQ